MVQETPYLIGHVTQIKLSREPRRADTSSSVDLETRQDHFKIKLYSKLSLLEMPNGSICF